MFWNQDSLAKEKKILDYIGGKEDDITSSANCKLNFKNDLFLATGK